MAKERAAGSAAVGQEITEGVLKSVRQRFAQFRKVHRRGTRIPEALRAAAVSAVERGVTRGALEHACGISYAQVTAWQREIMRVSLPRARVFKVVDAPDAPEGAAGPELVLRVGTWSVTVRQEGGGAPCCR